VCAKFPSRIGVSGQISQASVDKNEYRRNFCTLFAGLQEIRRQNLHGCARLFSIVFHSALENLLCVWLGKWTCRVIVHLPASLCHRFHFSENRVLSGIDQWA
jgi:hypothetical protein